MSKLYSKELLNRLTNDHFACIIIFTDGDVHLGRLNWNFGSYELSPLTINMSGITFRRSHVKQIVLFNGLVFPKEENGKHKVLNILELNELVNKAGYEFL